MFSEDQIIGDLLYDQMIFAKKLLNFRKIYG